MGFSALSASVSSFPSFSPWRPKTARQGIRPKNSSFNFFICHRMKKEYKRVSHGTTIFFARLFVGQFCSKRCHLFTSPPSSDRGKDSKRGRKTQRSLVRRGGGGERKGQFIFRPHPSSLCSPLFSEDISCLGEESMSVSAFFSILANGRRGGERTSQMCLRLKRGGNECGTLNSANAFSPFFLLFLLWLLSFFPRRRWNRRHSQLGFVTLNAP